jgi:hypothetical protein
VIAGLVMLGVDERPCHACDGGRDIQRDRPGRVCYPCSGRGTLSGPSAPVCWGSESAVPVDASLSAVVFRGAA